jgi:peptide/nickel transport system substrate-binding protein
MYIGKKRKASCLLLLVCLLLLPAALVFAGGSPEKKEDSTPASAGPSGLDRFIGELEGPEIVTDASRFPKRFKEAPELSALAQSGKLPPVAERIGQDPLVIKPLKKIGKYGGILNRGYTGMGDTWSGVRIAGHDTVLQLDYRAQDVKPSIARDYKMAEDGKSMLLYLRRGMKWSDGKNLTAEDFMFWYKEILLNKELFPNLPAEMNVDGTPVGMEIVDQYTIKYTFAKPYYFFPEVMIQRSPGCGISFYGTRFQAGYMPAHYLRQYLPANTPAADLDKMVKDAGFNNWIELLRFKCNWSLNSDLPVVTAWKTVQPANTGTWVLERNPYSVWVDTEGNQLPYIDKIVLTSAENLEVLNMRTMAGDYDYQDRNMEIQKLPLFVQNQEKGNYDIRLDPGQWGADMELKTNLDYKADPEIGKFLANVDFRCAISLGINRDQLNQAFWLGLGVPGSTIPHSMNVYYPGDKYKTLWHTYDPRQASQLLDSIGLDKKDAEGFRLRTDGKGRLTIELTTISGAFIDYAQIAEMIRQQLKAIGLDITVTSIDRNLENQRGLANQIQILAWANDTSELPFTTNHAILPNELNGFVPNPEIAKWYLSEGREGTVPPPAMREALELFKKAFFATDAERITLGKRIWELDVDNLFNIGIVGLSPAQNGLRIVKKGLANTPARQYNSNLVRAPQSSVPEQFFWE